MSKSELINVPNILLFIRLLLVPIIIVLLLLPGWTNIGFVNYSLSSSKTILYGMHWTDLAAGILFIFASLTDFLDGWWARKFNKITKFGKLFDPLADKILVNSTLILFSARGFIPILFTIIFIVRDILVDGLRMMMASDGVVLSADKFGKLKTIFQMLGLILLFFIHPIDNVNFFDMFAWHVISSCLIMLLGIALFFSIVSGINYFVKGFKIKKQD